MKAMGLIMVGGLALASTAAIAQAGSKDMSLASSDNLLTIG